MQSQIQTNTINNARVAGTIVQSELERRLTRWRVAGAAIHIGEAIGLQDMDANANNDCRRIRVLIYHAAAAPAFRRFGLHLQWEIRD